jgi:hypothetical protein
MVVLRQRIAVLHNGKRSGSSGKTAASNFLSHFVADGNGNRKGNHFGRQKGAGSAIEKGTTLLTHN